MKNWFVLNKWSNFYLQYRLLLELLLQSYNRKRLPQLFGPQSKRWKRGNNRLLAVFCGALKTDLGRCNTSHFREGNQKINKSLLLNRRGVKWLKFLWRHNADKVPPPHFRCKRPRVFYCTLWSHYVQVPESVLTIPVNKHVLIW